MHVVECRLYSHFMWVWFSNSGKLCITGRKRSLHSGSTSSRQSSTHRVRKGRVTRKDNTTNRRRKGSQSTKGQKRVSSSSRTKLKGSSSTGSTASTSAAHREASWQRWKEYIESSLSTTSSASQYTSPHTTASEYSEISTIGILKASNSGPTCEMPVRFRLPNSSRIVYPTKSYGHNENEETDDDSDSSLYQ